MGRSLSEPDAPAPTPRGRAYRAARSVNRAPQGRLKSARRSHEASIRTSGRAASDGLKRPQNSRNVILRLAAARYHQGEKLIAMRERNDYVGSDD